MRAQLPGASPLMQTWRVGVIWVCRSLVCLVLLLLWQPAMTVAELKSQQNMIAVVLDDSRSMGIADKRRRSNAESAAIRALEGGRS